MSRRAPRPFAEALGALAGELAPDTTLSRVQAAWRPAVGEAVASACRPTREREGVLTVVCSEAVWAHELELMGDAVVERLNEALGGPALRRLRCQIG